MKRIFFTIAFFVCVVSLIFTITGCGNTKGNNGLDENSIIAEQEKQKEKQNAIYQINQNNDAINNNNNLILSYQSSISLLNSYLLQNKNDQSTYQRYLNSAKNQLAIAKNKRVYVYRSGKGMVYESDGQAIAAAQAEVEQCENVLSLLKNEEQEYEIQIQSYQINIKKLESQNLELSNQNMELKKRYGIE